MAMSGVPYEYAFPVQPLLGKSIGVKRRLDFSDERSVKPRAESVAKK
jgi:hypothetical protein